MQLSRRAFFGAARYGQGNSLRPPWALPEADFITRCTRCDDCITACPTHLLVKGAGGFPEAEFTPRRANEGCTFCADCVSACQVAALHRVPGQSPWQLHVVFTDECLAARKVVCHTCSESCDSGAIRFQLSAGGISRPELDEEACTGCALCLADCPTQAIRMVRSTSDSQPF